MAILANNSLDLAPPLNHRLCRRHDNKVIFTAEAVETRLIVFRIIFPSIVHQKSVFVSAGEQQGRLFPYPIHILLHGVLFGIPLVEISHEYYLFGMGRRQGEGYLSPFNLGFGFHFGHALPPFF